MITDPVTCPKCKCIISKTNPPYVSTNSLSLACKTCAPSFQDYNEEPHFANAFDFLQSWQSPSPFKQPENCTPIKTICPDHGLPFKYECICGLFACDICALVHDLYRHHLSQVPNREFKIGPKETEEFEKQFYSDFEEVKKQFVKFVELQPQYKVSVGKIDLEVFTEKLGFEFGMHPTPISYGFGCCALLYENSLLSMPQFGKTMSTPLVTGYERHSVCIYLSAYFIIFGGICKKTNRTSKQVNCVDFDGNVYSCGSMKYSRCSFPNVVVDMEVIIICCGYTTEWGYGLVFNKCEGYSIKEQKYFLLPDCVKGRMESSAFVMNGMLYVVGGFLDNGEIINSYEKLNLKKWDAFEEVNLNLNLTDYVYTMQYSVPNDIVFLIIFPKQNVSDSFVYISGNPFENTATYVKAPIPSNVALNILPVVFNNDLVFVQIDNANSSEPTFIGKKLSEFVNVL